MASDFDRDAEEALRLAGQVGGRWPEYVQRSVDARDGASLASQTAALRNLARTAG